MTPLALKIKARIIEQAPLPFSEYMALCLFDPEYGYYTNLQAIGARGDFVTAPELGPYFANALAQFLEPKLQLFQAPVILELGGGTGQLAFDLLHALKEKPTRYLILEKSPSLQAMQQQKLKEFNCVEWHSVISKPSVIPAKAGIQTPGETGLARFEGIILANEFFDALPVERFVDGKKTFVDWQNDQFVETGKGERFERCEILSEVLTPILSAFKKGLALTIDYGDEHIDRSTLTAYHQHQIVSPFAYPGESDLTAHVDFTELAKVFLSLGWEIDFLKPQNQFLLEQGILPETGITAEHYALKRLLDPRLMGERFKVCVATLGC